jgi:hypothetical protein
VSRNEKCDHVVVRIRKIRGFLREYFTTDEKLTDPMNDFGFHHVVNAIFALLGFYAV